MSMASFSKSRAVCTLGMLLVVVPAVVRAEGAVRVLDCKVTQICDAAGVCQAASEEVSFRMAPEKLSEDGAGTYEISYRDIKASMQASSYAGPFYWTTGAERNTLLASSETQFLWHRLRLEPAPETKVHFLECAVR